MARPVTNSVLQKAPSVDDTATDKALRELQSAIGRQRVHDGAQLLEDIAVTTTDFARIKHRLGRRPKGYHIVRTKTAPGAAFVLYDDNDNRTDAAQWLYLRSVGADVTLTLVVF